MISTESSATPLPGDYYLDPAFADASALLDAVVAVAPDIVYVYDLQKHRNVFVGGAWRSLGYSGSELQALGGRFTDDLVHPADTGALLSRQTRLRELASGEAIEQELRLRHRDGSYRLLRCREAVLGWTEEHDPRYLVGFAEDVTEQRQLYTQLKDSEEGARAKASELEAIAARLSAADRRKDEFLALLAHELRNPLAPIRTSAQRLSRMPDLPLSARQASDVIERQVRQLTRLVEDLLDVSRFVWGKVTLRQELVCLNDAIDLALQMAQPLIDERQHELAVGLPGELLWVRGDLARLAQVIANLLDNSAKYTSPGGRIALTVSTDRTEAVVLVQDNGAGIDPEFLPRIFEVFSRGSRSESQRAGGLGLGLSLVQQLVAAHGGTASARSDGPGLGAEIEVRLPLAEAPDAPVVSPPLAPVVATPPPQRILVVDDNRDAADALAMYLKDLGHFVEVAGDGEGGLAVAERLLPAFVVLDIGLPGIDGHELARRLRSRPWAANTVILALSGYDSDEDRRCSLAAGCNDHLVKPVDAESLVVLVANYVADSERRLGSVGAKSH